MDKYKDSLQALTNYKYLQIFIIGYEINNHKNSLIVIKNTNCYQER